ncbi:MAG: spore coat protein CotJB [Agathobacter sp.]
MMRPNRPPQMNRKELYEWIMMLGFCALDMALYLDTHPDDAEALNYFNQCNELYHSAKDTYEEQFEPLTMLPGQPLNSWDWNSGRMPWEGGR